MGGPSIGTMTKVTMPGDNKSTSHENDENDAKPPAMKDSKEQPILKKFRQVDTGLESRNSWRNGSRRNVTTMNRFPMSSSSHHSNGSSNDDGGLTSSAPPAITKLEAIASFGGPLNVEPTSDETSNDEMTTSAPPKTELEAIASFGGPLNVEPTSDENNNVLPVAEKPQAERSFPSTQRITKAGLPTRTSKSETPIGKGQIPTTATCKKVSGPPAQYRTSRRSTAISGVRAATTVPSKNATANSLTCRSRRISNEEDAEQSTGDDITLPTGTANSTQSDNNQRISSAEDDVLKKKKSSSRGTSRLSAGATNVIRRVSNRLSRWSTRSSTGTARNSNVIEDPNMDGKPRSDSRGSRATIHVNSNGGDNDISDDANPTNVPNSEKRTPESIDDADYQPEAVRVGAFRVGPVEEESFLGDEDSELLKEKDVELGSPKESPKKTNSLVKKTKVDDNMRDKMVQQLSAMLVVEGEEDFYVEEDDDKDKAMLVHAEPVAESRSKYIWRRILCLLIVILVIGGIGAAIGISKRNAANDKKKISTNASSGTKPPRPGQVLPDETIKLQIMFAGDQESYMQDTNTLEELVINYSALYSGLSKLGEMEGMYPLHLMAGDLTLPNLFFDSSQEIGSIGVPGGVDYLMLNEMNVSATVIGNNDMDAGLDAFANFISKAKFPFLAADLDFSNVTLGPDVASPITIGEDGGRCSDMLGMVAKSCYYDYGTIKVGLIGRGNDDLFNSVNDAEEVLPGLKFFTGRDSETNKAADVLKPVQEQVQVLRDNGVHIIILLDNSSEEYNFASDELIASSMEGISIVVSAGRALQAFDSASDGPFGYIREEEVEWKQINEFPIVRRDKLGNPVLYIHTLGLYRYIGHLIAEFDLDGNLISWDTDRSGPIATTAEGISRLADFVGLPEIQPVDGVVELFEELRSTPSFTEGFNIIGTTDYPLIPSRDEETNMNRLVVDAYHWESRRVAKELLGSKAHVDIALINTGGIRNSIQGPNIIHLSIDTTVPFNNAVMLIEINGAQLLAALENGLSRAGNGCGCFPAVSGIRFVLDETRPAIPEEETVSTPSRIKSLILYQENREAGGGSGAETILIDDFTVQGDFLQRTFVVATHGYVAGGGSGYISFVEGTTILQTESYEQQFLEDYIVETLGGVVKIPTQPPAPLRIARVA